MVMQKSRTIDDHRTRYPRDSPPSSEQGAEEEGLPEQVGGQSVDNEIDPHGNPPYQQPPSSSPVLPPDQPASPVWDHELDDAPGHFEHLSSPIHARTPPGTPPDIPMLDDESDGAGEAYGLRGDGEEVDHEYPFDQLLDNLDDDRRDRRFLDAMDAEYDNDPDGIDANNELYNEDFGLPEGEDEIELPQFQFALIDEANEEFDLVPNDDPDDVGDNLGVLCEALQEHETVRNVYIDAFIQKVVYGATHRALKHQLRAARRTIAANPNVPLEDIANMAQTIKTVENRLGVNTDSIVTTFTLCPICKRRYLPEYIATTDNDTCVNEECEGVLFTVRNLASGS